MKRTSGLVELLRLNGEPFVREAYFWILGRPADRSGITGYTPRAYGFCRKCRILVSLLTSAEMAHSFSWLSALIQWWTRTSNAATELWSGFFSLFSGRDKQQASLERLYTRLVHNTPNDTPSRQEVLRRRYSLLLSEALCQGNRAVQLGCGRGEWLEHLNDKGFQAIGVDSNPLAVRTARQRGFCVRCDDSLHFLRRLPSASISMICGFHVLEGLDAEFLWRLFKEFQRTLLPGGVLLLETVNPEHLQANTASGHLDRCQPLYVLPDMLTFFLAEFGFLSQCFLVDATQRLYPVSSSMPDSIQSPTLVWVGYNNQLQPHEA